MVKSSTTMRSFFAHRFWVILLSILAVGALMALAVGLGNVPFREAQAFGREEVPRGPAPPWDLINSILDVPLQTQVGIWVLLLCMVALIGTLLSPELRKRWIRIAIRLTVIYWAWYIIFTRYHEVLAQIAMNLTLPGALQAPVSSGELPPEFTPPQSVSWTAYLASFGIVVLLALLVWRLRSVWNELNAPASPIEKLAQIARSSLRDLSSGRDSSDVIMNCYYRMGDVISDKKNLQRNASMTPNEFAVRLEQAGLPAQAVQRLTRLFESVRYGGHRSDTAAVNEAVACLTTILHHCGETV